MSGIDDTNDLLSTGGSKLIAFRFACRNFLAKFDTKHSNSIFPVAFAAGVVLFAVTLALVIDIIVVSNQPRMHGVVSCDNTQCAAIGTQILAQGGNAVDAAVATALCAGVVHPHQSGLGGGGFMIIYNHRAQQSTVIDFRETAPQGVSSVAAYANLTSAQLSDPLGITRTGGLAVATPGELAGLYAAHSQFGTLPWSSVVTPAAQVAANGFVVSNELARGLQNEGIARISRSPLLASKFIRNGALLKAGDTVTLPELAATLTSIAANGLSAFYSPNGTIAKSIVSTVSAAGGVLSAADLANYSVRKLTPVTAQVGDYRFVTMPPPSAGGTFLLMVLRVLSKLEPFNNASLPANVSGNYANGDSNLNIFPFITPFSLQTVAGHYENLLEAFKYAYANVAAIGDPQVPGANDTFDANAYASWLVSDQFVQLVSQLITSRRPGGLSQYDLFASFKNGSTPAASAQSPVDDAAAQAAANSDNSGPALCGEGGGTAHFSTADDNELYVSMSSSLNGYFGSCLMTPEGIILNNHIDDFTFDARRVYTSDVHNSLRPLARPRSCMTPAVVYNPNALCDMRFACGGAGAQRIPAGLAQTVSNLMRLRLESGVNSINSPNLVKIVENPRFLMAVASNSSSDNTATTSTYGANVSASGAQSLEATGNGVLLTLYEKTRWQNVPFANDLFASLTHFGQTVQSTADALNVIEFAGKVNEQMVGASDSRRGGVSSFV